MKTSNLQRKRALYTALLVLLLSVAGMTKSFAQDYSFVTIGDLKYHLYVNTSSATVACHVDSTNATGNLTIPSSVTYTSNEWVNGQYVPVTRTYSVTTIGNGAFENCTGLTGNLTIPNSVTLIGGDAFWGCNGFTGSLTIGSSVTIIEPGAFGDCRGFTGSLTIPNSVTSIGGIAFGYCTGFDGSLTLGTSLTMIGGSAFKGCGFTDNLIIPNSVTTIGSEAFMNCSGFTGDLTIPNSVTMISNGTFSGCIGFTGDLVIPNSVTSIGINAFWGCSGFSGDLIIGNSVTTIGANSFRNCGFIGNLTIGNSVRDIEYSAFYNCNGFTSMIVLTGTPPSLESNVFGNVPKDIPVYVPCHSIEEYQSAYGWNEFTNYIEDFPFKLTIEAIEPNYCTVSIVKHPSCEESLASVKAEPAPGYTFVAWEEDGVVVSNEPDYTFTVDHDIYLLARVGKTTGVSESGVEESIAVYPNPTHGKVRIEAENIKNVAVYNLMGQRLFEAEVYSDEFEYDFTQHSEGFYFVRIETANGVVARRVTVIDS